MEQLPENEEGSQMNTPVLQNRSVSHNAGFSDSDMAPDTHICLSDVCEVCSTVDVASEYSYERRIRLLLLYSLDIVCVQPSVQEQSCLSPGRH